jgi:hypothetical protein
MRPSALTAAISLTLFPSPPLLSTLTRSVTPGWADGGLPTPTARSAMHGADAMRCFISDLLTR